MESSHRFETLLDGREFFLDDHRVLGEAVLPGAAYLEMARAATVHSGRARVLGLRNVVWLAPVVVNGTPRAVRIEIAAKAGKTRFSVRSARGGASEPEVVHGQGEVVTAESGGATAPASRVDIDEIRARCASTLSGADLYALFERQGLTYGETFRCIEELRRSDAEVLARFRLAPPAIQAGAPFELHPGVTDAALQSTVGLLVGDGRLPAGSVHVPFSLKELVLHTQTPAAGYVVARWSPGASPRSNVLKFDIDIVDEAGAVCVSMREFASRRYDKAPAADVLFGTTTWLAEPLAPPRPAERGAPARRDALVLLAGESDELAALVSERAQTVRLPRVLDAGGAVEHARVVAAARQALEAIQRVVSGRPSGPREVVALASVRDEAFAHAPLAGLLKTMRREHRDLRGKLVLVPAELGPEARARLLSRELEAAYDDVEVRYDRSERREVRRFIEIELAGGAALRPTFEAGGVYWLTGGLGGLGRIFARHIAGTAGATVVLTGRSPLSEESRAWLDALRAMTGATIDYLPADVADERRLRTVLADIKERHGRLTGILHGAGVLRDSTIAKKTAAELEAVFAAKALGLLAIDEATRDEDLDFLVLFSSASAVWGNAGQADYVAANALLDEFAVRRNELVKAGRRSGRTLSIGWPLWRSGGMKVDDANERMVERAYGLVPLDEAAGLWAFEVAMRSSLAQVVVLSGHAEKLRSKVIGAEREAADAAARVAAEPAGATLASEQPAPFADGAGEASGLRDLVERTLVRAVSRVLKIQEADIELDVELSTFGFDSLSLTELSNRLSAELGVELLPTVFFEHPSLAALETFLLATHLGALARTFRVEVAARAPRPEPAQPPIERPAAIIDQAGAHDASAAAVVDRADARDARPARTAIIGISGRFPQASDVDAFWSNLIEGRDCIEVVPEDRWDWRAIYGDPHAEANKTNVKWGGFIDELASFDPQFFGISPKEAELMDPQHRLLMEHVWSAMEDAGYSAKALSGTRTGVFLAIGPGSYRQPASQPIEAYSATGAVPSMAPNRISFFLNLRGPSEPVETACSSALIAVHRAVQAIDAGVCDQAFVGAVNVMYSPELHICFSKAGMLSVDGRCKTFSRRADGYVRGEGVGVMLLKRLRQAQADRDAIYGVIRGTNVNHGGRAASLTAPNASAQAELLFDAYSRAGVDVRAVTYVETHGTGTPLGDPVEINALKKAFGALYERQGGAIEAQRCALGSVKTNVGHLEVAAGIAGIFKVLMAMHHGELPKTLHCEETNPYIELEGSPFFLLKERRPWLRPAMPDGGVAPRLAGISGFGFGGANAHVIVEEHAEGGGGALDEIAAERPLQIVPLSARSEARLRAYAGQLLAFLREVTASAGAQPGSVPDEVAEQLRRDLVGVVAATMAIQASDVSADERFADYGADLGLLANEAHRALGIHITAQAIGEAGSIDALVPYLFERHRESLCARYLVASRAESAETRRAGAPKRVRPGPALLVDVAYTLQVGRDAMDHRVAFLARDVEELERKLERFLAGAEETDGAFTGQVRRERDSMKVLNADASANEMVATWMRQGKLASLCELWVRGLEVDWERLYGERKPRRIHLPTYPFERERYWLPQGEGAVVAGAAPPVEASCAAACGGRLEQGSGTAEVSRVEAGEAAEVVEYEEVWERLGWEERERRQEGVRWLVVGGDEAWRASVVEALRREEPGSEALGVSVGGAYGWEGSARCTVPEASEVWFRSVFERLGAWEAARGGGGRPCGVVYAWGRGLERLRGVHALVRGAKGSGALLRRLVLTGRQVRGEVSGCYDAALIGVERSLGLVLPELSVGVVLAGAEGIEAGALAREVWSGGVIRHEGGERQRLGVRRAPPSVRSEAPLRDGGVYVITGGAGGLGRLFAEHLARRCAGRLALVGRRGRDEQIEGVLSGLRGAGAREAEYYEADVSDAAQMRGVVAGLESRWGSIHGVLHAAGVESRGTLLDKRWEEVEEITRPKIEGTRVVDEVTAGHPLDFMCLFSSTAASLGDGGSCDYASANRFQVAYAQMRQELRERGERSGATVAVCWPLWRAGGMGTSEREGMGVYLRSSGQRYLESDEGLEAWERAMGAAVSPRLVFAGQPRRVHAFLSRIYAGARASAANGAPSGLRSAVAPAISTAAAPGLSNGGAPARHERGSTSLPERVVHDLKVHAEAVLKIPAGRLDEETSFADIGFDSIALAQFARLLTTQLGFDVLPNTLLNHSTIRKLAGHLVRQHREALEHRSRANGEPAQALPAHPALDDAPPSALQSGRAAPRAAALSPAREEVAIIGMSARVAGADDADALWALLLEGRKQIQEIPSERWDFHAYYEGPGAPANRIATNRGAFLRGLDEFDPLFFEISPREAQWMDPRQRLMLEAAWAAFEDAGHAGARLRGTNCGVFIGVEEMAHTGDGAPGLATSHHNGILAARISYVLDLHGPNLALNTACSSGLVAVHTACQSLLRDECSMALAGGVNVLTSPLTYIALSQSGMLSADGECYAFDERASGMVPGEAVAAVVLKRLSRAIADGDPIHAVIKATGVNYDGKTNGITAPSSVSQQHLVERVLRQAELRPADVQYVLGHSVGSQLGDPVEVQALRDAFRAEPGERQWCALGSIKPLIGHTFAASGVVSLMAMCLAMKHETIPATRNYRRANEYIIDIARSPFFVSDAERPWIGSGPERRRRGLVGATGMSGTNAFVLIEEHAPSRATLQPQRAAGAADRALIALSAKSDAALRQYAQRLRAHLVKHPAVDLHGVAYTLQTGREAMPCRLAIVAPSVGALIEQLDVVLDAADGRALSDRAIWTSPSSAARAPSADGDPLHDAACAWAAGGVLDTAALYPAAKPTRLAGLPTYPFARRSVSHGERGGAPEAPAPPARPQDAVPGDKAAAPGDKAAAPGDKAAEYYTFDAQRRSDDYREEYLTFCPFEREVPGFSMTRVLSAPEAFPDEYRLVLEKQLEMRRVIFRNERSESVRRVLDIGCGCGTDLVEVARRHPHAKAHGFTITRAQADLANRRIRRIGLAERVQVFHADSSKDRFPDTYDLILGFEVTCHIADKTGVFGNISSALSPHGSVLLMDFVSNLRGAIVDGNVDIAISTQDEWIDVLTASSLVVDDIVDLSPQIANYVFDPDVEKNIAHFPEAARRSSRNFANMAVSLREEWISYCLLRLTKADPGWTADRLRAHNASKIAKKTPYAAALAELQEAPGSPRPEAAAEDERAPRQGASVDHVRRRLEQIFEEALQLTRDELAAATTFSAMGVGSLIAVRLLQTINTAFDLREPTSVMFQFHDLQSLAEHLASKIVVAAPPARATAAALAPPSARVQEAATTRQAAAPAEGIAIVGMSCRCAGARDKRELWDVIVEGRQHVERVEERYPEWREACVEQGVDPSSLHAGFIDDADCFDSLFFDISPVEADQMDASQRLVLEGIHAALEDAGYDPRSLSGRRVGTFIGSMGTGAPRGTSHLAMLGSDGAILSSRIAYHLNFAGPAITVNSACSSSLVAVELACQKLRSGDIDMAVAGGVTLYSQPASFVMMHNAGMLSPSGRCRPFDDGADGIVVGDGVGVVVLMPLSRAIDEGAHVYGVIRAIGTNQDGKTSGITAPSFLAQSRLEREVYEKAGISPEQLQVVEAHGTGTKLGDPVEIHALTEAFRASTQVRQFCAIGSLKANIGHTTAASGVLGLIKVLLAMEHGCIPPAINFTRPNRHIDLADSPFYVSTRPAPWPENPGGSRFAAVSAFGFSGTNAHVVIEGLARREVAAPRASAPPEEQVVVLSAKRPELLDEYARRLLVFTPAAGTSLADVAWTLQIGRAAMDCRLAIVAATFEELRGRLSAYLAGAERSPGCFSGRATGRREGRPAGSTPAQLAAFWASGGAVSWEAELHRHAGARRRVPLPTYPFERVRFARAGAEGRRDAAPRPTCLVEKTWLPARAQAATAEVDLAGRCFAILATPGTRALAEELLRRLPRSEVVMPEDVHAAVRGSAAPWDAYAGCVDLTGLDAGHRDEDLDWIAWLQELVGRADARRAAPLVVLQVTSGLERFRGGPVRLAGAKRSGLYRMLQSEYSKVLSRHVDTDAALDGERRDLVAQVVAELGAASEAGEVCYRDGVRYEAALERADEVARAREPGAKRPAQYPPDEVLWITGGTRGIGMLCAKHFVDARGVRKLVLMGREALPERAAWDAYLTSGSDEICKRKIEDILYLEARGAQVRVSTTPLTDEARMASEVARVRREMGEALGVIHCAGNTDFTNPAFVRKTRAGIEGVSAPKVRGVDVLRQVFADVPLRFVLLFSSVAAAVPRLAVGQSEYAMANAYLDYIAAAGFGPKVAHCASIQWPSWKDTGMGAASSAAYRSTGLLTCADDEGLRFLDEILARRLGPIVMPLVIDEARFDARALLRRAAPAMGQAGAPPERPADPGGHAAEASRRAPSGAPREAIARHAGSSTDTASAVNEWLRRLVSQELKVKYADVDAARSFDQYGVDSIMLAQMIRQIDAGLPGIKVDPTVVIENPSIERLAAYLVRTYRDQLDRHFADAQGAAGRVTERQLDRRSADAQGAAGRVTEGRADKVAIVGMACHFPGAPDIQQFWTNLCEGKDAIGPVPASRWDAERYHGDPEREPGRSVSKWGGFLEDIESFDPSYFGIQESIAIGVDPLARQWLEVCAEALADAGYGKTDLWDQRVGVFCGTRSSNYASKHGRLDSKAVIGVGQNFISAHLSHSYNFAGPNVVVDTACASALTAVHLAVQSIERGESALAVAGGVDILLDEGPFVLLSSAKILSSEGRCKTFDETADGIGIGEGCGVVILKPLSAALRDGDKVYGVIDGSAINCDGHTMGITTPNPRRQQELIERAIAAAGVDARTISYVEAHGTGTLIGDPIELRSLTNVLGRESRHVCGVGSVKSNLGHLLSAAGAAGLVKVLLSIVHRRLPPTLHCSRPNPRFDFEQSPLYPVLRNEEWAGVDGVHRAGVSAFGLGGHNAHVIVSDEGIPEERRATMEPRGAPVVFERKRYWPDAAAPRPSPGVSGGADSAFAARVAADAPGSVTAQRAMPKYFAVKRIERDVATRAPSLEASQSKSRP
ncbi:SDR family NAD(P)-dependent oxidoreductase [Sorangium sp. KYC3313]|uniref:SDR family NAD(P)-dependent oxidoreductase n=1 Tax=Sorangium sp. KYC3313 TaxID=3449740 RepID=UPI003F8BD443